MVSAPFPPRVERVAFVSVHGCPMMTPGMGSAGGMNVFLRRIAPILADQGVEVDVYTRSHHLGGPEVFDFDQHSRVVHLPAGDPGLEKDGVAPHLGEYADALLERVASNGARYDLVHSHYWLSAEPGRRLAERLGVPHVFTYHTVAEVKERAGGAVEPRVRRDAERLAVEGADAVVTFTGEESAALGEFYGLDPRRAHVVQMGVDDSVFRPRDQAAARTKLGIGQDDRVVLFVGRIDPFKGPDLLLRSLARIADRRDIRVLLIGGAEEEHSVDWLKEIAEEQGVSDKLDWRRAVPQHELPDYYSAANVCAVPSRHETFGLAALEAMACGTAVVASNVGGLRGLVVDGETGSLVTPGNPDALSNALNDLLANPARARRMGAAGADRARGYTWPKSADALLRAYETLLHSPVPGSLSRPRAASMPHDGGRTTA